MLASLRIRPVVHCGEIVLHVLEEHANRRRGECYIRDDLVHEGCCTSFEGTEHKPDVGLTPYRLLPPAVNHGDHLERSSTSIAPSKWGKGIDGRWRSSGGTSVLRRH